MDVPSLVLVGSLTPSLALMVRLAWAMFVTSLLWAVANVAQDGPPAEHEHTQQRHLAHGHAGSMIPIMSIVL